MRKFDSISVPSAQYVIEITSTDHHESDKDVTNLKAYSGKVAVWSNRDQALVALQCLREHYDAICSNGSNDSTDIISSKPWFSENLRANFSDRLSHGDWTDAFFVPNDEGEAFLVHSNYLYLNDYSLETAKINLINNPEIYDLYAD